VPRLDAVVDDAQQLPALPGPQAGRAGGLPALEAPAIDNRLEMARALAKENPAAMANIVRSWVAKEA
jgi:flagellar M-ring protein FliF